MAIFSLVTIVLMVLYLRYLNGTFKVYAFLQKICVLNYIFVALAPLSSLYAQNILKFSSKEATSRFGTSRELFDEMIRNHNSASILHIAKSFSYHFFNFLAVLFVYDIKVMICYSLFYAEFKEAKKVVKRIVLMALASLLLTWDDMIFTFHKIYDRTYDVKMSKNISWNIFSTCLAIYVSMEIAVVKISLTLTALKFFFEVKSEMMNSLSWQNERSRAKQAYHRLAALCLIPVVNNGILLFYDIPQVVIFILFKLSGREGGYCSGSFWQKDHVVGVILTSCFWIASLLYLAVFLFAFPKFRKALKVGCTTVCGGSAD